MKRWVMLVGAVLLGGGPARAALTDPDPQLQESTYATVGALITGLAWAPDDTGRLFTIHKDGVVRVTVGGAVLAAPFAVFNPVFTNSECGLLGMAFDPDFLTNGWVYFFVTISNTRQQIVRLTAVGNAGVDPVVVVDGIPTAGINHDGGAVVVGADGRLYFAVGDQGSGVGVDADLQSLAAKVNRASRVPGAPAPLDNPFHDGSGPNQDLIYARGFRNPFTMTVQPDTGALWVNVVGNAFEQVFRVNAGDHAGWNDFEVNQPPGFLRPVMAYRTDNSGPWVDPRRVADTNGMVRLNNVVTVTTAISHYLSQGQLVSISGVVDPSFDITGVPVRSVVSNGRFTVAQNGPNAASGGGILRHQMMGRSISGGVFYDATLLPGAYRGNLFLGDYVSGQLLRAELAPDGRAQRYQVWGTGYAGMIDAAVGPDGALYFAALGGTVERVGYQNTAQNLVVSSLNLRTDEGGRAATHVSLATAPPADVTVVVSFVEGDGDIAVAGPEAMVFTPANHAVPQTLVFAVAQDEDSVADVARFQLAAPNVEPVALTVRSIDDDPLSILVTPPSLRTDQGSTAAVMVRLGGPPSGVVTVTASLSGDPDVVLVAPAALSFDAQNHATAQALAVESLPDADALDDDAVLTLSASNLADVQVVVHVVDTDARPPQFTSDPVLTGVVGVPYRYQVAATGSPAPQLELAAGPTAMRLDDGGALQWLPAAAQQSPVELRAANGVPPAASQSFMVSVQQDRPPTATLTMPVPGATVSGAHAEFFGDGVDDVGLVRAQFFVDGDLAYVDENTRGHYHLGGGHLMWDTTALTNGPHQVRMTVVDTAGQSGTAVADVQVRNVGDGGQNASDAARGDAAGPADAARADASPQPDAARSDDGGPPGAEPVAQDPRASGCACQLHAAPNGAPTVGFVLGLLLAVRRLHRH